MDNYIFDVVVIGGGPAGLAAAISASSENAKVLIVERDMYLGGILEQCIHLGFGLKYFGEELTGPEYADKFIQMLKAHNVEILLNTMVLSIDEKSHTIQAVNTNGSIEIKTKAIVLAMGCRERTRSALSIPGSRPAGVFTAGTAQRFLNMQNYIVGKKIVILGSGDIGMIMARRLSLEGSKIESVVEIMPYLAGLTRNKVQCLDDFDIPLYLSHTIIEIRGKERVTSVVVAKVDKNMQPIIDSAWEIECDTILLSVGLIPENELSKKIEIEMNPTTLGPIVNQQMQTSVDGVFACGNVLHVNDLVDNVSMESNVAGKNAALYALNKLQNNGKIVEVNAGEGIRYVVPNTIIALDEQENTHIYFRANAPIENALLALKIDGKIIKEKKCLKINPGEMEDFEINTKILLDNNAKAIEISIIK